MDQETAVTDDNDRISRRIARLFYQKLAAHYPDHPWVKNPRQWATVAEWRDPRPVDQWYWMDIELQSSDGTMIRYGRVSWNKDGTGHYDVSISYEREGVGLYSWPSFRALSDAQDFVERLMAMSLEEARAQNGTQWPNVVL